MPNLCACAMAGGSSRGGGRLPLPSNVIVIGTVNVDETTYMFSPKVLDRAFVHEFRVSARTSIRTAPADAASGGERGRAASHGPAPPGRRLAFRASAPGPSRARRGSEAVCTSSSRASTSTSATEFSSRRCGLPRSRAAAGLGGTDTVLDYIVMTKLLPKVHGSRQRLETPLAALQSWAWRASRSADDPRLPRTAAKLERMIEIAARRAVRDLHGVSRVEVRAPVLDATGTTIGELVLSTAAAGDRRLTLDGSTPQVVEGGVYRYEVELERAASWCSARARQKSSSASTPRHAHGSVPAAAARRSLRIAITVPASGAVGTVEVEVAPTKLEYASEYQQMLGDIADGRDRSAPTGLCAGGTDACAGLSDALEAALPAVRVPQRAAGVTRGARRAGADPRESASRLAHRDGAPERRSATARHRRC